jgi:cytochrome c-type biogenesis protein
MLPIILGASLGHHDPIRPLLITIGFTVPFSLIAFLFGLFPSILGLSQETLRDATVVMLLLFGVLMVWPFPFELLSVHLE